MMRLRALCTTVATGALLATGVSAALADTPVATILDVQGPVTWRAATETVLHPAHGGEQLFVGALVRTGVRGIAHMAWRNGGDFRLMPLGELAIPEGEGVTLNSGSVWAAFAHHLLVPFFFQTPNATAVVRGTVLGVELEPQGATHVAVLEGKVEVSAAAGGNHVLLIPGQAVTVSPFGQMGPLEPVSTRERTFSRRPDGFVGRGPDPNDSYRGPQPQQGQGGPNGPNGPNGQNAYGGPNGPGPGHDVRLIPGIPVPVNVMPGNGPNNGGPAATLTPVAGNPLRASFEWLNDNRAADRLEPTRQNERQVRIARPSDATPPTLTRVPGAPQPPIIMQGIPSAAGGSGSPGRPGDGSDVAREAPQAISPDRAFPADRPDADAPHDKDAPVTQGPPPATLNCVPTTNARVTTPTTTLPGPICPATPPPQRTTGPATTAPGHGH